jgi:hypothetical protein
MNKLITRNRPNYQQTGIARVCRARSWPVINSSSLTLCALAGILAAGLGTGCDATKPGGAPATPLFSQAPAAGAEKWTIRCLHSASPAGAEELNRLAEMLKRVNGLQPGKVRVVTDSTGASLNYGEYVKSASPQTGLLVFPPEYQRDLDLIRRLAVAGNTPFKYAAPELLEKKAAAVGEWDISKSPAAYTLLIAVFYNDADVSQREQAAEGYVKLLREAGYPAYYRHEQLRSYVFVGDFTAKDVVSVGSGKQFGPKVENFIRGNEQEFRNVTENGRIHKRQEPGGKMVAPQSYLVPVPKEAPKVP